MYRKNKKTYCDRKCVTGGFQRGKWRNRYLWYVFSFTFPLAVGRVRETYGTFPGGALHTFSPGRKYEFPPPAGESHFTGRLPHQWQIKKINKNPWGQRPQGRKFFRGTTLITLPKGKNHSSDSSKSYLCNGRTRISLLTLRSQDRLRNQIVWPFDSGSHQPPALCNPPGKTSFPSKSLGIYTILNHNPVKMSICRIAQNTA